MIVYRDVEREADPRVELEALAGLDDPTELLIGFGALEAGLADALLPERDAPHPVLERAGRIALATGRHFAGRAGPPLRPLIEALARDPGLPRRVRIRVAEGYAWYALQPLQYVEAGRELARLARGEPLTVIGLRSIGTSLSALVAAGFVGEVERWTLRPRGHPFERRPVLDSRLAARLAARPGSFAIVDEGPGLSGSSLAGAAEVLGGLGIADRRIVLVPAWRPDPMAFRSALAQARWPRHRVIRPDIAAGPQGLDLSGGRWRELVRPEPRPPVQPQHERRKLLVEGRLHRFAGLGPYGRPLLARARALHGLGFVSQPHDLKDGYLALDWVEGWPVRDLRPHLPLVVAYLAGLARLGCNGGPVEPERLFAMIEANLGAAPPPASWRGLLASARTVPIDGRLMPHEWLETGSGLLKTDALDHHADHFFPGLQDVAWDVAGAVVEGGLNGGALADRLARELSDPWLPRRLPFYLLAYAGFRHAYARLCAQSLPSGPDRSGFARLSARYRRLGRAALARLPASP